MEAARVLFIGRIQANRSSVVNMLEKRYLVLPATSGKQGIDLALEQPVHVVVLDAVSLRTPGDRICGILRQEFDKTPIVHIHPGPKQAAQSSADVLLFPPFTARKLTNTIDRLLEARDEETISYGTFSMNVTRRILIVNGQETQLTPKQAALIEIFLRHPGEILSRRLLMEKVWQTDYMGDTRTLDVHIRWIREAIEPDPGKPRYLRTMRGVGYCLEIPDEPFSVSEMAEIPMLVLSP